jgi:hypothetical protein
MTEKTTKQNLTSVINPTKQGTPGKESLYILIPKQTCNKFNITKETAFALYVNEFGTLTYKRNPA